MRYLGLDLGTATIGLALADDLLRTARPLDVVRRSGTEADLARLREVAAEWEVDLAVVGLPLHMNGAEGVGARRARAFAERLGVALRVPVELFDERLSTFEAGLRLRERGIPAREGRAVIDAEAAAVILQGWLDGRGS